VAEIVDCGSAFSSFENGLFVVNGNGEPTVVYFRGNAVGVRALQFESPVSLWQRKSQSEKNDDKSVLGK